MTEPDSGSTPQATEREPSVSTYQPFPAFREWPSTFFDDSAYDMSERRLQQRRDEAGEEALRAAVETATRYAAVDTGAIEGLYDVDRGFTKTVATQAAAWESVVDAKGSHVRRAIEDALSTYEAVLDAATRRVPVTEMWIRQLHETICASQPTYTVYTATGQQQQRTLVKGQYKDMPNNPTSNATGRIHNYASVPDTSPEMARLVREFASPEFDRAHPIIQAAYAHYAFVCIHPFADGNGRVARALASTFLYRRPGVPLVVFADQRDQYLDALEAADEGDAEVFINFVEARTVDTIEIIYASVHPSVPPAASSLAQLQAFYSMSASDSDLEAAAQRLCKSILDEFQQQLRLLAVPRITMRCVKVAQPVPTPDSYRLPVTESSTLIFMLESPPPAQATRHQNMTVFVKADASVPDLLVVSYAPNHLPVALREIQPTITAALRLKIAGWVEGQIAYGIYALRSSAESMWRRAQGLPEE